MTSLGSTVAASEAGAHPMPAELDVLEAELDTLKADVQHMRAEAESKQQLGNSHTTKRQHGTPARAEGSKIPQSTVGRSHTQVGTSRTRASTAATLSPTSETSAEKSFGYADSIVPYHDAVEYQQAPTPEKPAPRFAQPTQAANRRVDETLRRDTPPAKSSPETSPGKSTKAKAPNFATDQRAVQRNQKRTSLPEGWMSYQDESSPSGRVTQKKEQQAPGSGTSLTSADQSPAGPKLRKKTSSYMSPTKAAQHRSIATIGEEKRIRISPRVSVGGLRVNTNLAGKGLSTMPLSPSRRSLSRRGNGNDESIFSPKSQLSSTASSRKDPSSPLKIIASAKALNSSAVNHPGLFMRLPPLPQVANTTVIIRDSDDDILDPIKEKLGKEDLLRHDSTQESVLPSARCASRSDALSPVFARLDRSSMGTGLSLTRPSHFSEEESYFIGQPRTRDPDNEPMSRLISGLRGQSSAEIGKALASGNHEKSGAPNAGHSSTKQPSDALALNERRKRSEDPAILYQGRKPSVGGSLPQDPAIIFNSGPVNLDVPTDHTSSNTVCLPSSLRATATDFVPTTTPTSPTQVRPSEWEPEDNGDTWYPKGLSPFHDDDDYRQGSGTDNRRNMGFLPENTYRAMYGLIETPAFSQWQGVADEPMSPQSNLTMSEPFDLIHGETSWDTPTVSPTSNDTSPPWSAQQHRSNVDRWEILGKGRRRYHWTGGDGLEISFRGVGPDAEHDPNSPVVYRDYRANTNTFHLQAASYPRTHVPGSPLPPNAPKLMREYAEKMAWSQVPCTNGQWSGRIDCLPAAVPVSGLCAPCKTGDDVLHCIGGGIDLIS
jgi:hypothetical protein